MWSLPEMFDVFNPDFKIKILMWTQIKCRGCWTFIVSLINKLTCTLQSWHYAGCHPCRWPPFVLGLTDASTNEWERSRAARGPIASVLTAVGDNSSVGDGAQLEIWKGRQQTEGSKKTQRPCREASHAWEGRLRHLNVSWNAKRVARD